MINPLPSDSVRSDTYYPSCHGLLLCGAYHSTTRRLSTSSHRPGKRGKSNLYPTFATFGVRCDWLKYVTGFRPRFAVRLWQGFRFGSYSLVPLRLLLPTDRSTYPPPVICALCCCCYCFVRRKKKTPEHIWYTAAQPSCVHGLTQKATLNTGKGREKQKTNPRTYFDRVSLYR